MEREKRRKKKSIKEHTIGRRTCHHTSMLCRLPSSSSIKDRREALTTALRRRVSTFARPVRTLDPARGSSSACAPSLSSSSSTGNRGRDLRRRGVTMGISASVGRGLSSDGAWEPPDDDRFTCVVGTFTGSGLRIFLQSGPQQCIRR